MATFFVYILKSALCLVAYYLFYKLLLSRDTFYRFNRFALVSLLVCSMVLPLIHWSVEEVAADTTGAVTFELPQIVEITNPEISLWDRLIALSMLVYLTGIVFFVLRTIISYLSLWRLISQCRDGQYAGAENVRLKVSSTQVSPFSWMNYVVVNEQDMQENGRSILLHEMGHIRHHHTLDLLFTELCLIVQWFNPAIWLMREELQAIHEFEADEEVLNAGVNAREYQLLLIKKAAGSRLQSITNSLHQSSIKKRITMMQKRKSNRWAQAKYLLAMPVAALGIMLFATPAATAISAEISGCKVSNLFSNDQMLAEENAIPEANSPDEVGDQVFVVVEEEPQYPGGAEELMKFIAENLRYPKACVDEKVEGRVVLSFVVEKDGSVSSIEEMRSPDARLTEEAIRVVSSMPKWKPGKQRGKVVRVKYVLPVTFKLDADNAITDVKASSNVSARAFSGILVVDGKVLTEAQIQNLKPDDIASVEVFKDDAHTSQYIDKYPEAKNGVVVITLKK